MLNRLYFHLLIWLLIAITTGVGHAQDSVEDQLPTEKIDRRKDSNKPSNRSNNRIREIYKKSTWKIGYGNACIEEATQRMRFVYVPVVKSQPSYRSEFKRNWHNWWVKSGLLIRRGPWWKLVITKRIKDCRRKSGDMVG